MSNDKLLKAAADRRQLEALFPVCTRLCCHLFDTRNNAANAAVGFPFPFPSFAFAPAFSSPAAAVRRKLSQKSLTTPPHSHLEAEITSAIISPMKNSYYDGRD